MVSSNNRYSLVPLNKSRNYTSILSLVEHQGIIEINSPYPEFVLTGITKY